jgi:nitrite reductase (NADH) small subunit
VGKASEDWLDVCALDDLPLLGARVVKRGAGIADVAIFRAADGAVFALEDKCPHKGGPLSQGIVHGHRVACPLHNWNIELGSGEAVAPDHGCTRTYQVRVDGGRVRLSVAALDTAAAAPAPVACPISRSHG